MPRPAPATLRVKTGEGRTVLLDGRFLPPECEPVETPWSLYVQRRLDCGDLVLAPEAPAKPARAPAADKGATP